MTDPQPEFQPRAAMAETLAPGLRRVLAPNPSAMTFRGTNTYMLGTRGIAVIDPGPDLPAHQDAILRALGPDQQITHILVTHAHLDHAPLARPLAAATGPQVYAFGPAESGRRPVMQRLAQTGLVGGGEGVDAAFSPDIQLQDQEQLQGDCWQLEALHTPGHMSNHLSFAWNDILFTGDLVMGWASSLVSPPDGDLGAFMSALRRLQTRNWSVFHPGHGAPITEPAARLEALLQHRLGRESAILSALAQGPDTAWGLAQRIYKETPKALLPAASRNVLAHLIDLYERNLVAPREDLHAKAMFERL